MMKKLSILTGIKEEIINKEGIKPLLQRPKSITSLTKLQVKKLESLTEFIRLYNQADFLNEDVILDSSARSGSYCMKLFDNVVDKEYFYIILLNSQNKVINTVKLFEGTINECAIYNRELIKTCLNNNASSVILAHNHPAGSLRPSSSDIDATKKIKTALDTVQIKLIDHVICTSDRQYMSFAEKGIL